MRDTLSINSVNMFSKIFPAKIILFLYFYMMCVFVCFACCRSFLTLTSVTSIVSSLTDCTLFRLLLKTNYDGFLEKMSAIIIIFFSYLSNLFYYLFLYLFIIIFIHFFIYPFLVPHGEDMSLIHSKSALLFYFLFFC